MALLRSPISNALLGFAALRNPGLLGQVQQQQRYQSELGRQAEEDRRRREIEDIKKKQLLNQIQGQTELSGLLGAPDMAGSKTYGMTPQQKLQMAIPSLLKMGDTKTAMSLLGHGQDYGQPKKGINPSTGEQDQFVTDSTGSIKWLGTGIPSDPYYQAVPTAEGIAAFDARTGKVKMPDNTVIKSSDSPELQEKISKAKKAGQITAEQEGTINSGMASLDAIDEALSLLDKGIYSGTYGEVQKFFAKATPGVDKTKASNTEQYLSAVGDTVLPRLQEFGGNDSNEEMRYLQKIQAGEISMEEESMRNILLRIKTKTLARIQRIQKGEPINPAPPEGKSREDLLNEAYKKYGIR